MAYRAALLVVAFTGTLTGQDGTLPKSSAQDYPAHATLDKLSIGAEYLVHSFSRGREMYVAKDYLVVEVALYPTAGGSLQVNSAQFSLRVNGRKQALLPQAPEFVAASLKFPDTSGGLHSVETVGPVVFGEPRPVERFPGDPNARTGPAPPQIPEDNPGGIEKQAPVKPEELVIVTALQDGEIRKPASGFLYFPYRGKASRVRSLELVFASPAGATSMPLIPPDAGATP
jgi:hypothetical protein